MKPVVVLSRSSAQCATFFWRERPDFYVGYRFIEHDPEILETPLPGIDALPVGLFEKMPGPDRAPLQAEDSDPWEKGWSTSGMYWERTAYISNRHLADCLHASVDFGPLDAGRSRTLHGKFYFIEGTKENLLDAWRRDFPNQNTDR